MGTNPVSLGESQSAVDAELVFPPCCSLSLLKKITRPKVLDCWSRRAEDVVVFLFLFFCHNYPVSCG